MLLDAIDRATAPGPAKSTDDPPRADQAPAAPASASRPPDWFIGTRDAWARFNAVADEVT